jgi:hypothetical protein
MPEVKNQEVDMVTFPPEALGQNQFLAFSSILVVCRDYLTFAIYPSLYYLLVVCSFVSQKDTFDYLGHSDNSR